MITINLLTSVNNISKSFQLDVKSQNAGPETLFVDQVWALAYWLSLKLIVFFCWWLTFIQWYERLSQDCGLDWFNYFATFNNRCTAIWKWLLVLCLLVVMDLLGESCLWCRINCYSRLLQIILAIKFRIGFRGANSRIRFSIEVSYSKAWLEDSWFELDSIKEWMIKLQHMWIKI